MAARSPRLVLALLIVSLVCSATVIYALTRRPVPGWTVTLDIVSLLLVITSAAMLRRNHGGPGR